MSLSRMKGRTSSEVCADCNALTPEWASINRGVLICDECCSVHRSLGRHISQVRHLRLAPWNPSLLAMTQNLVSNGANLIWEHSLSDSNQNRGGTRKPSPKDPVHPIKSNFIKAKYQMLAFVHRLPTTDDKLDRSIIDLSKQLYSSVRTGNLETSLRLISLGAQPNYFQSEKGNTPLHVAAQAGQATQCELLVCHGADPSALDLSEKTAANVAIENGHNDLGFRLIELMYELTDRLTFYLCGRRPDHKNGINYLIPALQDRGIGESSPAKEARCKLQSLNNRLFEELCSDVYDEVDRRENDAVWLATQHHRKLVSDHTAVPFLPVNPDFTSTRNQGRQKLARFNALEFATLIVDILHDAKRREGLNIQNQSAGVVEQLKRNGGEQLKRDDLEPDYDDVADDDEADVVEEYDYDVPVDCYDRFKPTDASERDAGSEPKGKVHDLQEQNHSLGQEVNLLRSMVQKLMQENAALRAQVAQVLLERDDLERRLEVSTTQQYDRPKNNQLSDIPQVKLPESYDKSNVSMTSFERMDGTTDPSLPRYRSKANYDNVPSTTGGELEQPESSEESAAYRTEDDVEFAAETGPSQDDIVNATEQITKKIQELLQAAQVGQNNKYVNCSSNISAAVNDMANLFPKHPSSESVRMALRLMITSAARLQVECRSSSLDQAMLTQQVIQCAYDIAKAAKHLVTTYNNSL
ncbi:ARF GTPase-activating protein GIT1-like isoform X2 [Hydractinia symbiolongicarpus]|uniref:ARF GTPase-activating protein GIT1-like isoform X2 n=1 Tax=Hydractinia symbiolongicarpus TaxID=13093 RepID=UPI00254DD0F8|nr:ARF GTPase-activating protein GIT1-like isoform X2 [Hydractinia symbiolongicarpus]